MIARLAHLKAKLILDRHDDLDMIKTVQTKVLGDTFVQTLKYFGLFTLMKCDSRVSLSAEILSKALQTARTREDISSCFFKENCKLKKWKTS